MWGLGGEMLVFGERGKPEYPEKNLSEQEREPTNSAHIETPDPPDNRTRAILVGGECSHQYAIPATGLRGGGRGKEGNLRNFETLGRPLTQGRSSLLRAEETWKG